jgi:hypothetical protein
MHNGWTQGSETVDELLILESKKASIMDENGTSSKIESLFHHVPGP